MKNFKELEKNEWENLKNLVINTSKPLGGGAEGTCYLYKGKAFKIIENLQYVGYDIDTIITAQDMENTGIKHFAFPDEIFKVDGEFAGCTSQYIKNGKKATFEDDFIEFANNINFTKFRKAYLNMQKECIALADANIEIMDLPNNLLFDGNEFYGVDTGYYKKSDKSIFELVKSNLNVLDAAVPTILFYDSACSLENGNIDGFIKDVKQYRKELKKNEDYCY